MKQVTIDTVRERIAELEMVNSHGELSLRGEFELACLRMLSDSMGGVDDDVRIVVALLESNEWAEHCTKTELGQRLESEITRLVGSVQPATECSHTFEARPVDGSNSANAPCEAVCKLCGAKPEPTTDNTAQQFEALAGINANKHHDQWVNCSERLPDRFRDVPVMLSDGSQRVGRINHKDTWMIASYHHTKHQYTGDVVMWFDTPNPTSEWSGKL